MNIWQCVNYKTPSKYFVNTYIREYDLSKANITSLLYAKRINYDNYLNYLNMDKIEREIKIGLLIKKDRSIYDDIQSGIIYAKKRLLEDNNIEDYDIVSIKNDAVFIIGNKLKKTSFPPFKFNIKNVYNIYMQVQDLEVYYGDYIDPISRNLNTNIDIKGISEENLRFHNDGFLDLICDICYRLQRENPKDILPWICNFYELFIHRRLPKVYYRNFDSFSGYNLNTYIHSVGLKEIDDNMITCIDINRNLSVLRDLISIISDIHRKYI